MIPSWLALAARSHGLPALAGWRLLQSSAWLASETSASSHQAREEMKYDVLVVGAGPAGLSAAIRIKTVSTDECLARVLKVSIWHTSRQRNPGVEVRASRYGLPRLHPTILCQPQSTQSKPYPQFPIGAISLFDCPAEQALSRHQS